MSILITGATGFIGSGLTNSLYRQGYQLSIVVRNTISSVSHEIRQVCIPNLEPNTDWTHALDRVETIIHLAARAHIDDDIAVDPLSSFRKINTSATLALAQQAADVGVRRFIFISSIGVNGNQTFGKPFTADDEIDFGIHSRSRLEDTPSAYAISKREAEAGLRKIAAETSMEVVIIRPPLVYGALAPGNFKKLLFAVSKPWPLPFGCVQNQRSIIYVENLISFIAHCVKHPEAANHTFLVSDGEDISLSSLISDIRVAMGRRPLLLPVPVFLFRWLGVLVGKRKLIDQLIGDLQVDSSKARALLSWKPPFSGAQAIAKTVADLSNKGQ